MGRAVGAEHAGELGFDPDAPFVTPAGETEQGYVWHCHLLDHEDHEMMLPLRVVAPGGAGDAGIVRRVCALPPR